MIDRAVKTSQFKHQERDYIAHRDARFFAVFWEMGLGKTKLIQDVASYHFFGGRIEALLVIAPNSVYKNWIGQEMPIHMAAPYAAMPYPKTKTQKARLKKLVFLDPDFANDKLKVICISADSVRTAHGLEFCRQVTTVYKTMIVYDESTDIANNKTVIAKNAKLIAANCHYRWIASGTPVSDGPFKIHSQVEFLCPDFWKNKGMRSYGAFKTQFGIFGLKKVRGRRFRELETYQRLDYLADLIQPISSRLLKEDSEVDLPPKVYKTVEFELSKEQRRVYDALRSEFTADLDSGLVMDASMAIVRMTRLQQVASGLAVSQRITGVEPAFPDDPDDDAKIVHKEQVKEELVAEEDNPRLRALLDIVDKTSHKIIVFCRFTYDVDIIEGALGEKCLRYDGQTKNREEVLNEFREPDNEKQVLVANIMAISHGVTLTVAKTTIYYTNDLKLERRLQSEDRFHRIGQTAKSVLIIDLVAEDTVDLKITEALRNKYNIAASVMGDKLRDWI